ncbi:unnamed protein product [Cyclocybe aegerita]|uniref:Uncharacterized protein n=1 Tax=Cyclocybe aegerita TaxID=1973307 RepID=A0A8S0XWF8_CYCAE|nr:unnamed protein product [Cyclocybe aegerita]
MRSFLLISPLIGALLCVIGANAAVTGDSPVRRFALKGAQATQTTNLTPAELYARELTHKRPTRRSTAQRRQESELPEIQANINIGAITASTGSPLGGLTLGTSGLEVDLSGSGINLVTTASPSWSSRTDRRITISTLSGFPNLGLVQYDASSGLTLGVGLPNGVLVTGVADPGTAPGSLPSFVANYNTGLSDLAVETDVWTIDYITGIISAQWTNPDGSKPVTVLVTDGTNIAATGDVLAFNLAHGLGWFPITLAYTIAP